MVAFEGEKRRGDERAPSFTVRVPASTSNLGAGFDCFGLALRLYLSVRATVVEGAGDIGAGVAFVAGRHTHHAHHRL